MSSKQSGGHSELQIKRSPKKYTATDQQKKFHDIKQKCGITKGITKKQLQARMKCCISKEHGKIVPPQCNNEWSELLLPEINDKKE